MIGPNPYADADAPAGEPRPHPLVEPLAGYLGRWRGIGHGGYPTIDDFTYVQEARFAHDGRPFLAYESRAWLVDAQGRPIRPAAREVGWWRPQAGGEIEVLLAHPTGIVEVYLGRIDGTKVEFATDAVARTASAKEVSANHRLYGLVDDALMYAVDMAAVGQPLQPHLSARLDRVSARLDRAAP